MAAPDIILQSSYLLVVNTTNPTGIVPAIGGYQSGLVELVNELSDTVEAGQYILYNSSKTIAINYNDTTYFIVNEKDLLFVQNPPL